MSGECNDCGEHATDCKCKKEKKMKWIECSKKVYPSEDTPYIWMTDYSSIWIASKRDYDDWENIADEDGEHYAWAEIEKPEAPKQALHSCYSEFEIYHCYEDDGYLRLDTEHIASVRVEFCPFCGYSIKYEMD